MSTRFEMEAVLESSARTGGITEFAGGLEALSEQLDRLDGRDLDIGAEVRLSEALDDLAELERAVARLDGRDVSLSVSANTATADAGLKDVERAAERVDALSPDVVVAVSGARALAELTALERFAERVDGLVVQVVVRTVATAALAGLRAVESLASRIGRLDPRVEVRVDSARALSALRAVEALARRIDRLSPTIDVRADTRRASGPLLILERAARRIDRLSPTITARADTRGAQTSLLRFGRVATDTGQDVARLAATIGTRGASVGTRLPGPAAAAVGVGLVGALAFLAGGISPVVAGLTTAGVAAGALAAGAGLAAIPLLRVGQRMAGIREEGKKVPPELRRLDKALDDIKGSANRAFAGADKEAAAFSAEILNMSRRVLPQVGVASERSMGRVRKEFQQAANTVSPRQKQSFTAILDSIPGILGDGVSAAIKFGKGFLNIVAQMMPRIKEFWNWVDKIAGDFLRWSESDKGRRQIKEWIDSAVPVAKALGDLVAVAGGALAKLGNEHADTVADGIRVVITVIEGLISVLDIALKTAGWLFDRLKDIGSMGRGQGSGSYIPGPMGGSNARAYGGVELMALGGTVPVWRAAEGLTVPHYVTGPSWMGFPGGAGDVLYGEALSGSNREYAFPEDDRTTFITEEPGYDSASFGLWKDLGERKGYLPDGERSSRRGGGGGSAQLAEQNALLREQNGLLMDLIAETKKVSPRMKKDVDHILEYDGETRGSVERGQKRQRVFRDFGGSR